MSRPISSGATDFPGWSTRTPLKQLSPLGIPPGEEGFE
jgi:hypothetical protein